MLFVQNKIKINNNTNAKRRTQSTLSPTECGIFDPFCTLHPSLHESVAWEGGSNSALKSKNPNHQGTLMTIIEENANLF